MVFPSFRCSKHKSKENKNINNILFEEKFLWRICSLIIEDLAGGPLDSVLINWSKYILFSFTAIYTRLKIENFFISKMSIHSYCLARPLEVGRVMIFTKSLVFVIWLMSVNKIERKKNLTQLKHSFLDKAIKIQLFYTYSIIIIIPWYMNVHTFFQSQFLCVQLLYIANTVRKSN